jgi:Uma2 family endonuclease
LHASTKHEFVDGEIYAMAGASRRHNLLVSNLVGRAWNATAERKGCQVFGGDMKVYVEARNSFYYPDVTACCDPDDRHEQYLMRPCLIIEVLSPATTSVDRREKRLSYATLASLDEYVIVEQDRMRVDVYPGKGGPWMSRVLNEPEDVLELSCLGLHLTLKAIYAGVQLPPEKVAEPEAPEYAVGE